MDATHYCVKARGIQDASSRTETTAMGGRFKSDASLRQHFLTNAR
jgi:GTP cyclohydrolase I